MHEIALMTGIMDTVLTAAQAADARKITAIRLQIGEKAGVVTDALQFAFESVSRHTPAEGATLSIEIVPFQGICLSCNREFKTAEFLICPDCGGFGRIISGRELKILSIEVE
jgi:hydrogenase nickel incorporation protein HypA/HybF